MTNKLTRLELTWPGKEDRFNPEPRILSEDKEKSFSYEPDTAPTGLFEEQKVKPTYDNMLIHGDNLLALKALEQDYTGKIKCIYIDPPYNTGNAFEHYDDGLEHSIWLSLMRDRLEILRRLLSEDGMLFVQIDNNELHYLKVVMDEVFGRDNYRNSIITKKGVKNVQKQFDTVEKLNAGYDTILMYSKKSTYRIPNLFQKIDKSEAKGSWNNHWRGTDRPTMRYELLGITPEKGQYRWSKERSLKAVENFKIYSKWLADNNLSIDNMDENYEIYLKKHNISNIKDFELIRLSKTGKPEHYIPPSDEVLLSENWLDLSVAGRLTDFEHEKNEAIIERIIDWITNPNDIILDSFLGSGTTAAVAHKMGRRWIGVEMGDHVYTHCLPRLQKVIKGEDAGGVTKATGWTCGGGFKFYELASSLIVKDSFGMDIISPEYNADMLAEAMCKVLGYHYKPDTEKYWKQGYSSEKSFIYTTTMGLQETSLAKIAEEVGDNNLLICCKAFMGNPNNYPNITVKKIPTAILSKCEWGRAGYPLNLKDYTPKDDDFEFEEGECEE